MRVFKPSRKASDGKQTSYEKWYVEYRDHLERARRLPGFTDKKQTAELGRKVEQLVAARSNGEAPDKDLRKWIEAMPARIRNKLASDGVVDAKRVAAVKPLADHIDDYEKSMLAKGTSEKHASLVTNRARRLVKECKFHVWSDITAVKVENRLSQWREAEDDISVQTSNFYLQAMKQFCRWMIANERASESPVAHLKKQNTETDRRHDRRALTVDELRWLLTTTTAGPDRNGIAGTERALVYRLAVETGLRANEIRTLKQNSFNFNEAPATVTVEAGNSKRRRKDVLPMRADTAAAVRSHLTRKLPEAPAFTMPAKDRMAHILRADLRKARQAWINAPESQPERQKRESSDVLTYCDDDGLFADFHALRHTFITNLANSGVHPKVAQTLARHSTITLTMDRYSHSLWEDLGTALDGLPNLEQQAVEPMRATGTDDMSVASSVAFRGTIANNSVHNSAVDGGIETGKLPEPKLSHSTGITPKTASGSAWESNPPDRRFTSVPTALKTAARTSDASTSERRGEERRG